MKNIIYILLLLTLFSQALKAQTIKIGQIINNDQIVANLMNYDLEKKTYLPMEELNSIQIKVLFVFY